MGTTCTYIKCMYLHNTYASTCTLYLKLDYSIIQPRNLISQMQVSDLVIETSLYVIVSWPGILSARGREIYDRIPALWHLHVHVAYLPSAFARYCIRLILSHMNT